MAAAFGCLLNSVFLWYNDNLVHSVFLYKPRLRALPRTYRQRYARSCTLTLAVSLGLRPNPPKALPLETAQGAALRIR